jgi:pilus assembly protein Flp/PilA
MKNLFNRFVREESGQDIIEYVLLAAFISVVAWTIIQSIGNDVQTLYSKTKSVTGAAASAS